MKEIIKKRFSNGEIFFIGSVVLLLIVVAFRFFINQFQFISDRFGSIASYLVSPAIAGKVTVQQGIAKFSGDPLPVLEMGDLLTTYISLILSFVAGPTAFIFLWKKKKESNAVGLQSSLPLRIGYGISVAWVVLMPALIITFTSVSSFVFSEMKRENALSQYRDDVMFTLATISDKAQQYYILPVQEEGGEKSFLKENKPLILKDLGFEPKTSLGRFILYRQKSDTTLYLHFIGTKIGAMNEDFIPEVTHTVEYEVSISPSKYFIRVLH